MTTQGLPCAAGPVSSPFHGRPGLPDVPSTDDRHRTRRPCRHPRRRRQTVRPVPRRILAQARSRDGLSVRLCRGADQGRLSLGADSGRIWRRRPENLRGHRDPRGDPPRRLQRRRLPRPDVHHGHRAAARQRRAEGKVPAEDRQRRIAAAGVRRHRADQRHRHHVAQNRGETRRQRQLHRQRPEDLDQPRGIFRPDAAAGAHHAERRGQEAHRRPLGVPGRHARGQE